MNLQLRHLHYFIAVAEELNFRQAAEKLYVSQPTLSLQVAQLEEILEVRLFNRDKRRVSLTKAGELFYHEAQHILETVEQSVDRVRSQANVQPLTIGIPDYHSFDMISEGLHDFTLASPDIKLKITEMASMDMYNALINETLDVGFMQVPLPLPHEKTLETALLASEPFLVCLPASHPAYDKEVIDISDLENDKLFLMPREVHPAYHDMVINAVRDAGGKLEVSYEAVSAQAQYSLVSADLGICLALETSPLPPGLRAKPLSPPLVTLDLSLVWQPMCKHSGLKTFLDSVVCSAKGHQ